MVEVGILCPKGYPKIREEFNVNDADLHRGTGIPSNLNRERRPNHIIRHKSQSEPKLSHSNLPVLVLPITILNSSEYHDKLTENSRDRHCPNISMHPRRPNKKVSSPIHQTLRRRCLLRLLLVLLYYIVRHVRRLQRWRKLL